MGRRSQDERPRTHASERAAMCAPETETERQRAAALRRRRLGRGFPAIISCTDGYYAKLDNMHTWSGGRGGIIGNDDGMPWPVADGGSPACGGEE
jgi:hypothetical protein